MLKKLYLGAGSLLIGGYFTWSLLGWEWASSRKESIPRARPVYARGYHGGSRHGSRSYGGYRSSSGFGWGK